MEALYCGNSMTGVFQPGDKLIAENRPFSEFRAGDIVLFHPDGDSKPFVVHRVIRRTELELFTMGDNNSTPDRQPVQECHGPMLIVSGAHWNGKCFHVHNGTAGMRQRRWNRFIRLFRQAAHLLHRMARKI